MISFNVDLGRMPDIERRVYDLLGDLSGLNEAIADEAQELTSDYLREIAPESHATANRLGAEPTGALEKAAGRVTSDADDKEASVTVYGNLFARAFSDITITPSKARALTIPINAIAYGKRVGELEAMGYKFFQPRKEGGKPLLWATNPSGESMPMYLLATTVHQPQDRTLLPSDKDFLDAADRGWRNYLQKLSA